MASDSRIAPDEVQNLAKLSLQGDKRAYHKLLTHVMQITKPILRRHISDESAVDECVQIVLIAVDKSLHTYDPDKDFSPWIHAIIRYKRLDYLRNLYRQKDRFVPVDDFTHTLSDVTNPHLADEYTDIDKALSQLSDEQKQMVLWSKSEGYTIKDIAAKTGKSESAVKVTIHRAIKKIQQWAREHG